MGIHANAIWEPAETDGRADLPVDGTGMVCHLTMTVPAASDASMTVAGNQIGMTLTLTPDQMTRMGKFLTDQSRHATEYLRRYMNPDGLDGIEPGSCIVIPFDVEEARE